MNTATDASPIAPYSYPTTNSDLKQHHELIPHVEGGYFIPSVALHNNDSENDSNRIAVGPGLILKDENGKEEEETDPDKLRGKYGAPLASSIYHLLDPDSSRLYMHVNRNGHYIIHHAGRTQYTFLKPPSPSSDSDSDSKLPQIKRITLGSDLSKGEVKQLFVPGGWYKCSELPPDDLELVKEKGYDKERIGALVSIVVIPGWTPEQFEWITEDKLREVWNGESGWEEFRKYISPNLEEEESKKK